MEVPAAAERNKGPILAVLREYAGLGSRRSQNLGGEGAKKAVNDAKTRPCPAGAEVGFGAHSISAYVEATGLPNLLPPILLDVSQGWETWGGTQPATLDLLVSINMMHIAELRCTEGLFKGAGVLLKPGGVLFTYG
ncbi:MTL26 protein, partial [Scytalopus superciliaris]|nr:MTL26 protein [Scytalopus superciliaris]